MYACIHALRKKFRLPRILPIFSKLDKSSYIERSKSTTHIDLLLTQKTMPASHPAFFNSRILLQRTANSHGNAYAHEIPCLNAPML